MLDDLTFAPTHERADYCDAADEVGQEAPCTVSEAEVKEWEAHPLF